MQRQYSVVSQLISVAQSKLIKQAGVNPNVFTVLRETLKRKRKEYLSKWSITSGAFDTEKVNVDYVVDDVSKLTNIYIIT